MRGCALTLDLERRVTELERVEGGTAGSFTPIYYGQTTGGVTTYGNQYGFYTRVANVVFFTLNVSWTNATGTGNAIVGGLPIAASSTTGNNFTHAIWYFGVTYAAGTGLQTLLRAANTALELWNSPASNTGSAQIAIETAGEVLIVGFYFV